MTYDNFKNWLLGNVLLQKQDLYISLKNNCVFKLHWCVKIGKFQCYWKEKDLFYWVLPYLLKWTWRITTKQHFDKRWNYLPFQILLKTQELYGLIFSKISWDASDFLRIIKIALFSLYYIVSDQTFLDFLFIANLYFYKFLFHSLSVCLK